MTELELLIQKLRERKISVRVEAGKLVVNAPKGAITAALADAIKAQKDELVSFLNKAQTARSAQRTRILPSAEHARGALSEAQRRLWFLSQLEGSSAVYNMPLAVRIQGDIDIPRLEDALRTIALRHETLRTRFRSANGSVEAVVDASPDFHLSIWPAVEEHDDLGEQIRLSVRRASQNLFDLESEHGLFAALRPLGEKHHLLMLTLHHIIADGWSLANIINELSILYEDSAAALPTLPVQYADYVAWLDDRTALRHRQVEWWIKHLRGAPDYTPLPLDHPRPITTGYAGEELIAPLPPALLEATERLAQETESTPYIVLLAAFSLLINRILGSPPDEELVLGTTIANRDLPELEPLVGLFINMLPLRLAPSASETVEGLIRSTKAVFLEAHQNREVAFEKIVEAVNPPRALNHSPLFQITFDVQNQPDGELSLGACTLTPITPEVVHSKFDLSVTVNTDRENSNVQWVWNPAILDRETVSSWAKSFTHTLSEVTKSNTRAIDQLTTVDAELEFDWIQRQQRNSRPLEMGHWLSAFDRCANQHPDKIAVRFRDSSLSYSELRQRALRIAGNLVALGIRPGDRVVVLKERDTDLLVSLIAVHYAGASYIPLDPAYPEQRLKWVLEDAQPDLTLTDQQSASLPVLQSLPVQIVEELAALESDSVLPLPAPNLAAYTIFTSGSTGRPKGVTVEHQALSNFLESMQTEPGLTSDDRLLAVTTISFDIAVLELFLPLTVGACVVIASRLDVVDGGALRNLIAQENISILQATPSTWRLLLEAGWRSDNKFRALCGGEALPLDLAARIIGAGATLWNMYGPTETTIWSAISCVEAKPPPTASGNSPVGRGILNTSLYVLDDSLNLVNPGGLGELWIGGLGLARGYWARPGLTAERYRPDPFSQALGSRMYGTGDLVRIRPDGHLDFLGRLDNQIKLRGFRIELGEIEAALLSNSSVSVAVVIAVGSNDTADRLIAFIQTTSPDEDLRPWLRERLPMYMQPSQIISLDQFPLTPNGKVDRRALKALQGLSDKPAETVAPVTDTEKELADIWAKFLSGSSPNIDTNVFELGAHSLMLTEVRQDIQDRLDRPVELIDLFRYPSIRTLAAFLDGRPARSATRISQRGLVSSEIAIIGVSAILPGAPTAEQFWDLLANGSSGIQSYSLEQLRAAGLDESVISSPAFVPRHGAINDIEQFDAAFFGIAPSEAMLMDPQHRLLLQGAVHALEHAGYGRFDNAQNIGVYVGAGQNDYLIENILPALSEDPTLDPYQVIIGSEKDYLSTRISYLLNLTGPSLNIQTACSTGLVAVHTACRALRTGECEMALAGAVALRVPQENGHLYQEHMIVSPDGHCRPFEQGANGVVWGSGVVAFVLKPLEQARGEGDRILATIKGSAVNNDGSAKVGFTAPSVNGQSALIRAALSDAQLNPSDIQFIETHGTATALGDMIEFSALREIFQDDGLARHLGAVKAQIGHLNHAAGAAGLLKMILALQNKTIPPTPYFNTPNPQLAQFSDLFMMPALAAPWPLNPLGRIGAVSSFGMGGTNAHIILGEAPAPQGDSGTNVDEEPFIFTLSASSSEALDRLCVSAAHHWSQSSDAVADTAWTLIHGKTQSRCRAAVVTTDTAGASAIKDPVLTHRGVAPDTSPRVAFLFPGQGAQYLRMARTLYERFESFRQEFDASAEILRQILGIDLIDICCLGDSEEIRRQINETWLTQPILVAVEHALTRLWQSWGLQPDRLLGHSLGEITAACIGEVFDIETALEFACERGRIFWEQRPGAMLSIRASEAEVQYNIGDNSQIDIAAVNSPVSTVVSGLREDIDRLADQLSDKEIRYKYLPVSHPFHSRWMAPGIAKLADFLSRKSLQSPRVDIVSGFSGEILSATDATDPSYWANQLTACVQFNSAVQALSSDSTMILLEIGPGRTLSTLAAEHPDLGSAACLSSTSEEESLLNTLAQMWCEGCTVDISRSLERRIRQPFKRAALPPYPFEKTRHWIDKARQKQERLPITEWFSRLEWKPQRPTETGVSVQVQNWLFLGDPTDAQLHLIKELNALPYSTTAFTESLSSSGLLVFIAETENVPPVIQARDLLVDLSRTFPGSSIPIRFVSPLMHRVEEDDQPELAVAMLRGLITVAAQEFPSFDIRVIDWDESPERSKTILAAELAEHCPDMFVAYRSGVRYVPRFSPVQLPAASAASPLLIPAGTCLISGGTGRLGLLLARYLYERAAWRSILIARNQQHKPPPEMATYCQVLYADVGQEEEVARVASELKKIGVRVRGVIHAAGNPHLVSAIDDTPSDWPWSSVKTKVDGAWHLAKFFAEESRWGLMISSLASQLGGLGYSEYATSNAGLDAVALEIQNKYQKPWVAINFDAIAFDPAQPQEWIAANEVQEVMDRILNMEAMVPLYVSTTPIEKKVHAFRESQASETPKELIGIRPGMTEIETIIAVTWEQLLGHAALGLDDDYFDLGGDSLQAVRIVEALRKRLKRPVPMTLLIQHTTIRRLADALENSDKPNDSLRIMMGGAAANPQVVLLPGTGGSVMYLVELARCLSELGYQCIGLQARGLDARVAPRSTIEEIAADNLELLNLDKPITLIGHSLGSWIGLEMIKQAGNIGRPAAHLIAVDSAAPARRETDELQSWTDADWIESAGENIFMAFGASVPIRKAELVGMDWDAMLSLLHGKMVTAGLVPSESDVDFVAGIINVFKAQAQMVYAPTKEPITSISFVQAEETLSEFIKGIPEEIAQDPSWGWSAFATGPIRSVKAPGHHLTMVSKKHAEALANVISSCITDDNFGH